MRDWFASDLHLRDAAPQSLEVFARLLAAMREGDRLWLLGDLFDAWVGEAGSAIERRMEAMLAEAAQSHQVAVMRGNRDVLMGAAWCGRLGLRLLPDPWPLQRDGKRLLLSHGDLWCTADKPYVQARKAMRSFVMQHRFLSMPLAQRLDEVAKLRGRSQQHQSGADPASLDAQLPALRLARRAWCADAVLHGHTHLPGIHPGELDGRPRVVLGEWRDSAQVCRLDEKGFHLLDAATEGMPQLQHCAW